VFGAIQENGGITVVIFLPARKSEFCDERATKPQLTQLTALKERAKQTEL
jgi:hypothetical protein